MALPPVKMQIVMDGVPKIKTALKSLEKAVSDYEKHVTLAQKRGNVRRLNLTKKSVDDQAKLYKKSAREYDKLIKHKINAERQAAREIKRIRARQNAGFGLSGSRSSLGMSKTSRGGSMLSSMGGGIGQFAKIAAGAGAVGVALYALSTVVSAATGAVKEMASEMISGVMQIGGGFSISDSIVKAANAERTAALISANPGKKEDQMSTKQLMSWSSGQAKGSQFSQADWLEGTKAYQTKTGKTSGFMDNSEFFNQLATVSDTSLAQLADAAAALKLQFKDLTDADLKELMLKQWQAGKQGAIELSDTDQIKEATAGAGQLLGGGTIGNIMKTIGQVQMTVTDAGSTAEAITATKRFNSRLFAKSAEIEKLTGHKQTVRDETGAMKIKDIAGTLTDAAMMYMKDPKKAQSIFGERGIKTASAASKEIGQRQLVEDEKSGKKRLETDKELYERGKKLIEKFLSVENNAQDLADAMKIVEDTAQNQLKKAFNELTTTIGIDLLKALNDHKGAISKFVTDLTKYGPDLASFFGKMVEILPAVNTALEGFKILLIAFGLIDQNAPPDVGDPGGGSEGASGAGVRSGQDGRGPGGWVRNDKGILEFVPAKENYSGEGPAKKPKPVGYSEESGYSGYFETPSAVSGGQQQFKNPYTEDFDKISGASGKMDGASDKMNLASKYFYNGAVLLDSVVDKLDKKTPVDGRGGDHLGNNR